MRAVCGLRFYDCVKWGLLPMRHLGILLIGLLFSIYPAAAEITVYLDSLTDCGFTEFVDEDGLRIGAVILNIDTGTGCTENLDTIFNVASVPNVFDAATYYAMLI